MRRTRPQLRAGALALGLALCGQTASRADTPAAPPMISPGGVEVSHRIFDRCPTLSWGLVDGARGYELRIYEIEAAEGRQSLVEPPVVVRIAGNSSSWTASGELCLGAARRYAWTVRAMTRGGATPWASPLLFSIERGPLPPAELQRIVRQYLEQQSEPRYAEPGSRATGASPAAGGRGPVAAPAARPEPEPLVLTSSTPFSVDGSGVVIGQAFALDCDTAATYHVDADSDGYGDPATFAESCSPLSGYVENDGDCDDGTAEIGPGVIEVCENFIDDDCDGEVDEQTAWWPDVDGDTFGGTSDPIIQCLKPLETYAANNLDCDDFDPTIRPGEPEICGNGVDDDCDGVAVETRTWWEDQDGDGYGNESITVSSCIQPSGYEDNGLDCNDTDPDQRPGAIEICNGIDDDCDNQVDEDCISPR